MTTKKLLPQNDLTSLGSFLSDLENGRTADFSIDDLRKASKLAFEVLKNKQRISAMKAAVELNVGQRVTVSVPRNSKYNGLEGVITKNGGPKLHLKLDAYPGTYLSIAANCVKVI